MTSETLDIIKILHDIEIFSKFNNEILNEFSDNMNEVFLKKGEILFEKGEKDNALYIILDGTVEVHDNDYVFTTLNSKQFFGEYTLVDSAVRSASVTAIKDSHLLELKQVVFESVAKKNPEVWKQILVTLIKRLRDYNIVEEKLTMRTVEIRKKRNEIEKEKNNISEQKKELEARNTTKDKFFTIIGHDLKNPFNTITSITNTLLNKGDQIDDEKKTEYISQINKYSRNAYNLLENLLQWARSQTGSLKINFVRYNLKNIIDEVIGLYELNAQNKSITISSNIDSDLHGYFDVEMATTVIRNLLSNSLKFTNNNGQINITAIEVSDMIQVEVADTGIGISKEDQKTLFKIDKPNNEDLPEKDRTGLGMVLIKEFVFKNGGEIWVDSRLNIGTTVKFTLPKAL